MHNGSIISGASFALAPWSYIPLYALPALIGGCLLKVPIEVCDRHRCPRRRGELMNERVFQEGTIVEDPELGNEYKLYKIKVPIGLSHTPGERQLGVPKYRHELDRFRSLFCYYSHLYPGSHINCKLGD